MGAAGNGDDAVFDGLYLHEATKQWPHGTRVMRQQVGAVEQVWVAADDFMAVQKERDDARRTLAVLNALRVTGGLSAEAIALLDHHGLTHGDAKAMAGIIAQVRAGV